MKYGKKYRDSIKSYDPSASYDAKEALGICVKTAKAKFDETIELHVRLGVDSRHVDQQVRGAIILPNKPTPPPMMIVRVMSLWPFGWQRGIARRGEPSSGLTLECVFCATPQWVCVQACR